MDSKTLKAIQILAIKAVENPTYEDQFRFICRWFSKTYSVPLNNVNEYSEEEILQVWFEERFKEMLESEDNQQRKMYEEIRQDVLYENEIKEVEDDDEEWVNEMRTQIEKKQKTEEFQNLPEELNLLNIPEQGDLSDLSFSDDIDS